ncbi:MAG: asparagine synthase (glutamine-hydrolyzing) [Roseibacillus sp.]
MCGITGGLHLSSNIVEKMTASLRHRGPDSSAIKACGSSCLGFTRLAIQDIDNGDQPFSSPCSKITTICNGELYNWQELREILRNKGHTFTTQCDCEILPAAWLEWGTSLPEKLNGMFSLAIHDARTDSLFLARDRCGQKPLYYTRSGSSVLFASETKSFAAAGLELIPAPEHLATWLSLRYLPEPDTLFKNVFTLPAAHWMQIQSNGTQTIQRYWQAPSEASSSQNESQALDELDALTRSSVELALQADVPVAAYLSAGVDSSLLAHYARDLGADITTTSIGFGATSDESTAATSFAKSLGLAHHAAELNPSSLHDLPRVIQQMDRPVGDALILAFDHLASHTRALGCKVALGGEGPDEYFAGYSFQKTLLTAEKLGPMGRAVASAALERVPLPLLSKLTNFPASLGTQGRSKAATYLRDFGKKSLFEKATDLHTLFSPQEIEALLSKDIEPLQVEHALSETELSPHSFHNALALQYRHWLPDWSLIRQDKNTMAHSLEYRSPFLDHRIIDFASGLPTGMKIHQRTDKYLWRKLAERYLPHSITHRPKQPFYLPLEQPSWRTPFLSFARDVLTPQSVSSQGWLNYRAIEPLFSATNFLPLKQLAALVILQLWLEQHTSTT